MKSSPFVGKIESSTEVLNKLHAMKCCGIVSVKQIAKGIREREEQVSQWVMQRTRRPREQVIKKLRSFAAKQTLVIALNPKIQPAYRSAFNTARLLFPDGREELRK